jgi:hypothetical protein
MKRLTLLLFTIINLQVYSNDLKDIVKIIEVVETNSNPLAIGDRGRSFGILQIQKICVDDVNRIYKTSYTHRQMFQPQCAREVFYLYINAGIDRFERLYKREPTEKDIVRMWNGSIYNGYKKTSTIKYYRKYRAVKVKID